MLALLANNQIGILSFKNIIDNILFVDLHQVVLQLIHESMEKLIDIHLNARIDGLAIRNKCVA